MTPYVRCGFILSILCLALGPGVAHAEPPEASRQDPRVATLARFYAFSLTRDMTHGLFAHVTGPHADLCRLEFRDPDGEVIGTRWLRFGARHWEMAYVFNDPNAPTETRWWHERVTLDARGRVHHTVYTESSMEGVVRKHIDAQRYGWSPNKGLALVEEAFLGDHLFEDGGKETVTSHLIESVLLSAPRGPFSMRVTSNTLESSELEDGASHSYVWGDDGALRVRESFAWGATKYLYGPHGALREMKRTSPSSEDHPFNTTTAPDAQGRLASAVIHPDGSTAHAIYGCAWPELLGP